VHYFVNTSITATCMSVEVAHALQVCQWLAVGPCEQTEHCRGHDTTGLKTWNILLDKQVNIGPITQPSVGDNLRLFLAWFIAIFNNISFFSLRSVFLVDEIGPIFTCLSNNIFHVFSPVVSCPLQCSVCSSLFPFIVFLGFALSVFSDYLLLQLLRFS
jgi:hypothetical protein